MFVKTIVQTAMIVNQVVILHLLLNPHARRQVTRKLTVAPCKTINPMENMYDEEKKHVFYILFPFIAETTSTSPISIPSIVVFHHLITVFV